MTFLGAMSLVRSYSPPWSSSQQVPLLKGQPGQFIQVRTSKATIISVKPPAGSGNRKQLPLLASECLLIGRHFALQPMEALLLCGQLLESASGRGIHRAKQARSRVAKKEGKRDTHCKLLSAFRHLHEGTFLCSPLLFYLG